MIYRRSLLFAFSIWCLLCLVAAKPVTIKGIPKDCKVHKPAYSDDFLNKEILSFFVGKDYEQPEKTNQYWDVYSDRAHNTTYINNNTDTPYSELGFKEKVRIARIRKGFALVYKADDDFSVFPKIPADVEWKGWVPMENLVFMEKVMANDFGTPISVLVADQTDFDSQIQLSAKLYFSPVYGAATVSLPNCSNSIFYLIKENGPMALLATDTDLSSPSHIYGWMKLEDLLIWKSRIALEPTWDGMDINFLSQSGHSSVIEGLDKEPIGRIDFTQGVEGKRFTAENHLLGFGEWRFPVFFHHPDYSFCALPGQSAYLDSPSQRIPVHASQDSSDDSSDWLSNERDSDINIMFVIDGSRLYEPYFPILAQRISLMGGWNGASSIKVGALIYHDSRSGQYMTEIHGLTTPDDESLYDFLDMGGVYGFKDNLSEAPLLTALDEALTKSGFNPLAQNYIVLIGGRGDSSDSDLIPSEIAQRLASSNVGVLALQVQNNPHTAAYRLFGYLLDDILRQSVERKLEASVSTKFETGAEFSSISYFADNGNYTEAFDSFKSINNGLMSEEDFEANLEAILQWINNNVDSSVDLSASLSSMYPQFFRPAFLENSWNGRDLLKQVALYSVEDFDRLLGLFARLHERHLTSNTNREVLYSTLMDYLPPYIKLDIDNSFKFRK